MNVKNDKFDKISKLWDRIVLTMICIIAIFCMVIIFIPDILVKYYYPEDILNFGYYILFLFMMGAMIFIPLMIAALVMTLM